MLNTEILESAKAAYASKNYEEALRGYKNCIAQSGGSFDSGEAGLVYHMLGNCLMKMHSYSEASDAYGRALQDPGYGSLTSVHSNYALALSSLGNYKGAIEQFEKVLRDPSYKTPYKTYNGLGNAYMQLGDFASAGTAFRNAAVDESNPQPVKSLLNLGVCFMGLNRPADAVETYRAIFEFSPDHQTLNKTYANMGQAYVAMGQMDEAREAFENAIRDGSYQLSDAASSDYMRSLTPQSKLMDDSGIDVLGDGLGAYGSQGGYGDGYGEGAYGGDGYGAAQGADQGYTSMADNRASLADEETLGAGIPSADDTGFFTLPDDGPDDLAVLLEQSNAKPRRRGRVALIIVLAIVALLAAAAVLFWQGYGFPSQESTVRQLFEQHAAGADTSSCWVTTSSDEDKARIDKAMNGVAVSTDITIDYMSQSMFSSEVIVTATLPQGGTMRYDVTLSRDFGNILGIIGWKVTDIQTAFKSTNDPESTATVSSTTNASAADSSASTTDETDLPDPGASNAADDSSGTGSASGGSTSSTQ